MKHLVPEFEKFRERFPAGFESSLVLPCLHSELHDFALKGIIDQLQRVPYLAALVVSVDGAPEREQFEEGSTTKHNLPVEGISLGQSSGQIDSHNQFILAHELRQPGLAIMRIGSQNCVGQGMAPWVRFARTGGTPRRNRIGQIGTRATGQSWHKRSYSQKGKDLAAVGHGCRSISVD